MIRIIFAITTLLVFSIVLIAGDTKNYGKEISLTEKTRISDILSDPESYVGKTVLVEGTVIKVCAKRGCWIELSSDKEFETIRIKVKDGEIVFPMETSGKTALVQGEVYSFTYETEQECSGKECSHEKGEDPECNHKEKISKKIYQIKGIGAEI